jgi:pimeloyl-ACP methyl ester carboxylesterase
MTIVWTCRAYTLKEKFNIWKSKLTFLPETNLTNELLATNFAFTIPAIDIPVYFINGKYDFTVNIDLSRNYFQNLKAPLKKFYTFDHSAHSPLFEEPERFMEIMEKDVLKLSKSLAD